jgi:hypothetical protein
MLTASSLTGFRGVVGGVGLVVGLIFLLFCNVEHALAWSLVVTGILILAHLLVDVRWAVWTSTATKDQAESNASASAGAYRESAVALLSVPGFVLGLLTAFGGTSGLPITAVVQAGALSLVASIVLGVALLFLLSQNMPTQTKPVILVGYLVNLVFWTLSFGLLCIALAIATRSS